MKRLLILTALAAGIALGAESMSDVLQKAIYTQDTLGDLEGAIRLYRQVLSQAAESRTLGAQAQFRLGQCLLRKGAADEARQVFQKLIEDYPEQKELVAKAKELVPGDLKLSAEPWADGEMQVHVIRLPAGMEVGANVLTAESIDVGGKRAWRLQMRQFIPGSDGLMSVDADRDTFRPIRSAFSHKLLGTYELEYEGGAVRIRTPGKAESSRKPLDGTYYDNTQAVYILRRLPLAVGFKTELPNMTPMGMGMKIAVEVTARETITTPAGKFDTFKVDMPGIKQTCWISTDSNRYIAKMEVNGAMLELAQVRRADRMAPAEFRDADSGLSVSMPSGWQFFMAKPKPGTSQLFLIEPGSIESLSSLGVYSVEERYTNDSVEADLKERVVGKPKELEGYQMRSPGVQVRTVNGKKVASVVGDYREKGNAMVELIMWTQGGGKRTILRSTTTAKDFAALQGNAEAAFLSNVR